MVRWMDLIRSRSRIWIGDILDSGGSLRALVWMCCGDDKLPGWWAVEYVTGMRWVMMGLIPVTWRESENPRASK